MKQIIVFLSMLLLVGNGYSQPAGKTKTDSVSARVIRYLQMKKPDSIYDMAGPVFKAHITKKDFEDISVNQLFPLNDFKNTVFVKTTGGINKYKVAGSPELQLLVGLDAENKIETLLIQPFAEDPKEDAAFVFITDSSALADELHIKSSDLFNRWKVLGQIKSSDDKGIDRYR